MSRPRDQFTYGRPSSGHPVQLDLSHNGSAAPANEQWIQPVPTDAP
jgi:hypothetical protein